MIRKNIKTVLMSNTDYKIRDEGTVMSLADGVCWVDGVDTAKNAEVVKFESGVSGMVLNLEEKRVGVLVLDFFEKLKRGDKCYTTGEVMKTGVGEDLLGRVIDPLGQGLADLDFAGIDLPNDGIRSRARSRISCRHGRSSPSCRHRTAPGSTSGVACGRRVLI